MAKGSESGVQVEQRAAKRQGLQVQLRTHGQLLVLQRLNVDAPPRRLQQLPQPLDTHGGRASGGGGSGAAAAAATLSRRSQPQLP